MDKEFCLYVGYNNQRLHVNVAIQQIVFYNSLSEDQVGKMKSTQSIMPVREMAKHKCNV